MKYYNFFFTITKFLYLFFHTLNLKSENIYYELQLKTKIRKFVSPYTFLNKFYSGGIVLQDNIIRIVHVMINCTFPITILSVEFMPISIYAFKKEKKKKSFNY